jgi:hypothetical protein
MLLTFLLFFLESHKRRGREALTASTHNTFGKLLVKSFPERSLVDVWRPVFRGQMAVFVIIVSQHILLLGQPHTWIVLAKLAVTTFITPFSFTLSTDSIVSVASKTTVYSSSSNSPSPPCYYRSCSPCYHHAEC